MDEASETESQGRASKVDEDGSAIPAIITDEYFEEITSKCQAVSLNELEKDTTNYYSFRPFCNSQTVRSLLINLNTVAADEMQTLLTLAEHLRTSFENEVERVKQAQRQYDELVNRHDDMMKQWSNDKERIREQRDEIGKRKSSPLILPIFFC